MEKNKQTIFIVIIALLVAALGILGYFLYATSAAHDDTLVDLDEKKQELQDTYLQLDSLSLQLEEALKEKERLGEQDDSLRQVIDRLQREKRQIRSGVDLTNRRYKEIKGKLTEYEELLAEKDREIARLREENTALRSQTDSLSETNQNLSGQLNELEQTTEKLSSKLTEASTLKAYNVRITAVNRRGKERNKDAYRNRHIEKLKITFQIGENKAADPGNRKILVRVVEPNGKAVADLATGSGSFEYEGEELFYTTSKEILYDNTAQNVVLTYERGKDYVEGKHIVELYAEGSLIGRSSFLMK